MNVEENRLRTFADWPANAAVDAARIAKAGFYYSGHGLEVQCFLCGTKISNWDYGDQAMTRHRQAEPNCPFVQNPCETCNVPLVQNAASNVGLPLQANNFSEQELVALAFNLSGEPQKEYRTFSQRLRSFFDWPIPSIVSPDKLAKAGFYYMQHSDMVQCIYCKGILNNWEPGDDPDKEHRRHFPKCDFYMHQDDDDELDLTNVKLMPGTTASLSELGIQEHTAPRKPKHATYEGRLRTFYGWPDNLKQTPEMLSSAGFYYDGIGDRVRCFHCDGGLRNWESTDDAWTEHARWFPKCGFVNIVRGQEFIKECIANRPPLDPMIFVGAAEDENPEMSEASPASVSTTVPATREVTEAAVERLLHSPPAMVALEIGLHVGRVKRALKRRMQEVGVPYADPDQLIEDVLDDQISEDDPRGAEQSVDSRSQLLFMLNRRLNHQANAGRRFSDAEGNDTCSQMNDDQKIDVCGSDDEKSEASGKESNAAEKKPSTKFKETASLEEENRRLREARLCKICMDREVGIVFLPCGHLATCVHCAPSLTYCPMCRQEIRATVRTFLS